MCLLLYHLTLAVLYAPDLVRKLLAKSEFIPSILSFNGKSLSHEPLAECFATLIINTV